MQIAVCDDEKEIRDMFAEKIARLYPEADDKKFAQVLLNAVKQFEDRKKPEDAGGKREMPSLMITTGGKHITVNLEDIVYAEVFDRKVNLHTMDSDIEYY